MYFFITVSWTILLVTVNEAKVLKDSDICREILGDELIEEIWSYENVRDEILGYVLDGEFKGKTYDE